MIRQGELLVCMDGLPACGAIMYGNFKLNACKLLVLPLIRGKLDTGFLGLYFVREFVTWRGP
jgi:hypothetical protein